MPDMPAVSIASSGDASVLGFNLFRESLPDDLTPLYERLLAAPPVFYDPHMHAWVVSRYDDVYAILRDPARFSSVATFGSRAMNPPEVQAVLDTIEPFAESMLNTDPPEHTRYRQGVNKAFTPRRVGSLEADIRALAHDLVDRFGDRQADIISQFTYPLPMLVICRLMGVPDEDAALVKGWCDDLLTLTLQVAPLDGMVRAAHGVVAYQRYARALIARYRAQPGDNFTSDLLKSIDAGESNLTDAQVIRLLCGLVMAGHETTTNTLGNTIYQLLSKPQHWQTILENPSLIPSAVEETLRFENAGLMVFRRTTQAVELHGVTIPPGALVLLMNAVANREPAQFVAPHVFDLHRDDAGSHLGFGHGIHFCLGAPLARLEMRVGLEVLRERLPGLRLAPDQEIRRLRMPLLRGLERILVVW